MATVEVRGLKAGNEVVKLTVDATILPDKRVDASIALTTACRNVSCSANLTCVDGTCRAHPSFGPTDAGLSADAKKDSGTGRPRDGGAGDADDAGVTVKPECPPKMHTCPGGCVSDDDPRTCGASCTPCDPPPGGTATCDGKIVWRRLPDGQAALPGNLHRRGRVVHDRVPDRPACVRQSLPVADGRHRVRPLVPVVPRADRRDPGHV